MTDIETGIKQIRRLRVCNYFATLDEGSIGELAKMLTFAHDETIAAAAVDEWLEQETERPTPADLRRLVASHNEARALEPEPAPIYECAACQDTGLCGGDLGPEDQPWSLCNCAWAKEISVAELDEINAQWRRLRLITHRPETVKRTGKLLNVGEIYQDV